MNPATQPTSPTLSFLATLFEDTQGWIETRYIPDHKGHHGGPVRQWWSSYAELAEALPSINEEAERRGDAVFFGVLPRKVRGDGTAKNAGDGMVAWCDLDFKDVPEAEARERIAALPVPPSIVVHSGRGLHLYWRMAEPTPAPTLREISRRIAHKLGGHHCFDAARILRMPGSQNFKPRWIDGEYHPDEEARPVVIESATGATVQPFDFDVLPEAPAAPISLSPSLPLDAPVPERVPAKIKRLIERFPKLTALWKGEGKDHGDTSGSGYDLSLACSLILYGVTDKNELAAAVNARPRQNGKIKTEREVWRIVDRALSVIQPSRQEEEQNPPPVESPEAPAATYERPPMEEDDGVLGALAVLAQQVTAAAGDSVALAKIEVALLAPTFVDDMVAVDADELTVALAALRQRGFTATLKKVEKAIAKRREEVLEEAEALRAKAAAKRREKAAEKAIGEEWPPDRVGPHPGVQAALAYRKGQPVVCHANLMLILQMDPRWSGRFRVNLLGDALEMDKKKVDSETAMVSEINQWVSRTYDIHYKLGDVKDGIYAAASRFAYHPVRDYLAALPAWDGTDRFPLLLSDVLGIKLSEDTTPAEIALYTKFLRRFCISAVARAMRPGCKVDTALIFTGEQGAKKSTFFKYLIGPSWFGDSPIPIGDKNAAIQMRSTWGYECAELESLSKKTAEEVKQFLSVAEDLFRNVWERNARFWPRHSVICGSTNKPEFLTDPTGSRRFWPIPVPDDVVIDIALIRSMRDQVWAQAKALFLEAQAVIDRGETPGESCRWWFERDEDKERATQAHRFEVTDVWDALVMGYVLTSPKTFTIADILTSAIGMAKDRMDQAAKNRVGAILRRHGWRSKRARDEVNKTKFVDVWVKEGVALKSAAPTLPFEEDEVPV